MSFNVSMDRNGMQYVYRRFDSLDRWTNHTTTYSEWSAVPIGTRIVVTDIFRPKHLPRISTPRADGLHEVTLARLKMQRYTVGYGIHKTEHEVIVPVFVVPGDTKKRPANAFGNFAYADDVAAVESLVQFEARQRANAALANLFGEYGRGAKREAEQAQIQHAREERLRLLEERAAEIGVTVDELVAGIEAWNRIRRKRYPANRCMSCGRKLTDPASIVTGVGPECVKYLPAIKAAARARVLDIGRMRIDGRRLIERFGRAGADELVKLVTDAQLIEDLAVGDD